MNPASGPSTLDAAQIRERLLDRARQLAALRASESDRGVSDGERMAMHGKYSEDAYSSQPRSTHHHHALQPSQQPSESTLHVAAVDQQQKPVVPPLKFANLSISPPQASVQSNGRPHTTQSTNPRVSRGGSLSARGVSQLGSGSTAASVASARDDLARARSVQRIREHRMKTVAREQDEETARKAMEVTMKVERQKQHLETLKQHQVAAARGVAQTVKSLQHVEEAEREKRRQRFEKWQLEAVTELRRVEEQLLSMRKKQTDLDRELFEQEQRCEVELSKHRTILDAAQMEQSHAEAEYMQARRAHEEVDSRLRRKRQEKEKEETLFANDLRKIEEEMTRLRYDQVDLERRNADDRLRLERERKRLESEIAKGRSAVKKALVFLEDTQDALEQHDSKRPKASSSRSLDTSVSSSDQEDFMDDEEVWAMYLMSDGDPAVVADRQAYRELQAKLKSHRAQYDAMLQDEAEAERKAADYAKDYRYEWEVASQVLEWEIRSGEMMVKEDQLGATRREIDVKIEELRNDLRRKALENEERKSQFSAAQRLQEEKILERSNQRAQGATAAMLQQEDLQRQTARVLELEEDLKQRDAKEKLRFSVLLKQEKWVDQEQKRFDQTWKSDYRALQSTLRNLISQRTSVRKQILTAQQAASVEDGQDLEITKRKRDWLRKMKAAREAMVKQKSRVRSLLSAEQEALVNKQMQVSSLQQHRATIVGGEGASDELARLDSELALELAELKKLQEVVVKLSEEVRVLHMQLEEDVIVEDADIDSLVRFDEIGFQSFCFSSLQAEWLALEYYIVDCDYKIIASTSNSDSESCSMWEAICGQEKTAIRRMQESILDHEAKMRLMDRWRSHAAQENAAEATQVAMERASHLATLEYERRVLQQLENRRESGYSEAALEATIRTLADERDRAVVSEKQRLDAFARYVADVESQLSGLLEQRNAVQKEWTSLVESNRSFEEARRIALSSQQVTVAQQEREAMDKYRRQYADTFESWRNVHGERAAEQMIGQHMEKVLGIFREQVSERSRYFVQLRRRILYELPKGQEACKRQIDSLVEDLSKLRSRFHVHLKRIQDQRLETWRAWKADRELFLSALEEAKASHEASMETLSRLEREYRVVLEEEARISAKLQLSPRHRMDKEESLLNEKHQLEEGHRQLMSQFAKELSNIEEELREVAEKWTTCDRQYQKATAHVAEIAGMVRKIDEKRLADRKLVEQSQRQLQTKLEKKELEIKTRRQELDKASDAFTRDMTAEERMREQKRKSILRATSRKQTDLQSQVERLEGELAVDGEWLETASLTSAPSSPRLSARALQKNGNSGTTSGPVPNGRTRSVRRQPSADGDMRLEDFEESPRKAELAVGAKDFETVEELTRHRMLNSAGDMTTPTSSSSLQSRRNISAPVPAQGMDRSFMVHVAQIQDHRVFGPYVDPLSLSELESLQLMLAEMLEGSLVYKRNTSLTAGSSGVESSSAGFRASASTTPSGMKSSSRGKVSLTNVEGCLLPVQERILSLSTDLTRFEVRDPVKKVPESYVKVEHILKAFEKKGPSDLKPKASDGSGHFGYVFVLQHKDKPMEFMTLNELTMSTWLSGVEVLIKHSKHLFYLKFHLKFLLGDSYLKSLRENRSVVVKN